MAQFLNNWLKGEERRRVERRQNERRYVPPPKPPTFEDVKDEDIVTGDMFKDLKEKLRNAKWKNAGKTSS